MGELGDFGTSILSDGWKMDVLKVLGECVRQNQKGALATLVKRKGAAPREVGAKMVITGDGRIYGSIGGGCLEADVYEEAKRVIASGSPKILHFRLDGKAVEEDGMLCGGNIDILLEPLLDRHREIYERIGTIRPKGVVVTRIGEEYSKTLIETSGRAYGDPLPLALEKIMPFFGTTDILFLEDGTIVEPIVFPPNLYLFGAGHISVFIAKVAKMVDFEVTVIDDREEFASRERFPDVASVIARSYKDVLREMEFSENDYVVIVTRGHKHDAFVLEKVLATNPKYIGMIGSRRKVKAIFDHLLKKGFSEEELRKVYAPIGLEIGADTPQEIAVSIVAQLIKVRSETKRRRSSSPDPSFREGLSGRG